MRACEQQRILASWGLRGSFGEVDRKMTINAKRHQKFSAWMWSALLSIREAFIVLLPIVLVMNLCVALVGAVGYFGQDQAQSGFVHNLRFYYDLSLYIFPLLFLISLASVLAVQYRIDKLPTILMCFFAYMSFAGLLVNADGQALMAHRPSILLMIVVCLTVVPLYQRLLRYRYLRVMQHHLMVSNTLKTTLNQILPMAVVVVCIELLKLPISSAVIELKQATVLWMQQTPWTLTEVSARLLHGLVAQIGWFLGVHGPNIADDLFRWFGFANLSLGGGEWQSYFTVFATIGGSGATLGLVIAILLFSRVEQQRSIAKLSFPFAMLNINELILYGLPIVLNPIYFVPFVLVPFINLALGYAAIELGWFAIHTTQISWMTPPLLNIYQMSGGSWVAVSFQALVIGINVLCYWPFVRYAIRREQNASDLIRLVEKDRDPSDDLKEAHFDRGESFFAQQQAEKLKFDAEMDRLFHQLQGGEFVLYFQPKRAMLDQRLVGLEVLLRLRDRYGEMHPPTFIEVLHRAGLSQALDRKVLHLALRQIKTWESQGRKIPVIAINVEKPFLLDDGMIDELIECSQEVRTPIQIEITEHAYVDELDKILSSVKRLRLAGIRVAIDDFGAGYSSLTSLTRLEADEVKLDREFILTWIKRPQQTLWLIESTTQLCHQLGFDVVIEGVETEEQLQVMRECGVDIVQGYHTGRPMPALQVQRYFDES